MLRYAAERACAAADYSAMLPRYTRRCRVRAMPLFANIDDANEMIMGIIYDDGYAARR